ncbi:hypothetical protein WG66_006404, partial [Moniliophthora roreri]
LFDHILTTKIHRPGPILSFLPWTPLTVRIAEMSRSIFPGLKHSGRFASVHLGGHDYDDLEEFLLSL